MTKKGRNYPFTQGHSLVKVGHVFISHSAIYCRFMKSRYECTHFTDEEIKASRDKGIYFEVAKN